MRPYNHTSVSIILTSVRYFISHHCYLEEGKMRVRWARFPFARHPSRNSNVSSLPPPPEKRKKRKKERGRKEQAKDEKTPSCPKNTSNFFASQWHRKRSGIRNPSFFPRGGEAGKEEKRKKKKIRKKGKRREWEGREEVADDKTVKTRKNL